MTVILIHLHKAVAQVHPKYLGRKVNIHYLQSKNKMMKKKEQVSKKSKLKRNRLIKRNRERVSEKQEIHYFYLILLVVKMTKAQRVK